MTTARIGLALALVLACDSSGPDASGPLPATTPVARPPSPAPVQAAKPGDAADVPHFLTSETVHTTVDGRGDGPYRFTAPWHLAQMKTWSDVLTPLRGRQGLRYLEIGVFEGRSLLWMFENVLTDPSSTATAIDVFAGDYAQTFDANMKASGLGERVTKLVGPSVRCCAGSTPSASTSSTSTARTPPTTCSPTRCSRGHSSRSVAS